MEAEKAQAEQQKKEAPKPPTEKIEEKKDLGFIPSMVQRYCNSSNNARNAGDEKVYIVFGEWPE